MKSFYTLMLAMLAGNALAQIPNNGFETWTNMGTYDNPTSWGTLNNTTTMATIYTATQGTPGFSGSSFLKLTSKSTGLGVVNGIAVSGILDSLTMMPKSGFAYTTRPANLTGKWQHMIYGSSQGSIQVTLTRWDSGMGMQMPVGSGTVTLSSMAMSWASFTIPITYVDGNNPDTCIIIMKASGSTPTANDYLWVDNLSLSGTVLGIENNDIIINAISTFPNPSSDQLTVSFNVKESQNVNLVLINLLGDIVFTKNLGTIQGKQNETISTVGLSKGTYLVKLTTEKSSQSQKIIIE